MMQGRLSACEAGEFDGYVVVRAQGRMKWLAWLGSLAVFGGVDVVSLPSVELLAFRAA